MFTVKPLHGPSRLLHLSISGPPANQASALDLPAFSLLSPPYSSQTAVLGFLHILLSPFGLLCFSSCVHRYQVFSPLCCCCFSLHQPHGLTLVPQCLFLEVPYLKSIKAIISLLFFINAGMILFFLAINTTYGIH